MSAHARRQFLIGTIVAAGVFLAPTAQSLTINDGLTSTVTGLVLPRLEDLYVRNVGCIDSSICASPGAPTHLTLIDSQVDQLTVNDTSTLVVDGGFSGSHTQARGSSRLVWDSTIGHGSLYAHDTATILMIGGASDDDVEAQDQSFIHVSGGALQRDLVARHDSRILLTGGTLGVPHTVKAADNGLIEIVGSGFQVDGIDVGFGDIVAMSGILSGVLLSGQGFETLFLQGGAVNGPAWTGTIRLVPVPEPTTGLLLGMGLFVLGAKRGMR